MGLKTQPTIKKTLYITEYKQMKLSELPDQTRVKLSEEGREEFWHRVDEFGGIKQLSESFDYSSSKMYNWKSKESFLPIDLVRKVFGNEASDEIIAIKGKGRSKAIENPEIPLPKNSELLTRIEESVSVNSNGTPIYQTDDRGNAERFIELLEEIGEVPYSVYVREIYEVRYPKFLQQLFEDMSYEEHLGALIDEKGSIQEGKIVLPDKQIGVDEFKGQVFHRDKRLQLALARGDREEVTQLMQEEARRTQDIF